MAAISTSAAEFPMTNPQTHTPSGKLRARGAGVPFTGTPGPNNSITDVGDIEVGYCTLIKGEGPLVVGQGPVRTGVTAIFPHGRAEANAAAYAGYFSMSGNGELSGAALIEERGRFDGPITITNTHSCGVARDATAKWCFQQLKPGDRADQPFWMPVAGETYDGMLNDVNGFHVKEEHVFEALDAAHGGPIEEGSVGGGTGMRCYQYKGGSGTASREVIYAGKTYTVGAFVQANFGMRHLLHIAGIPIGRKLTVDTDAQPDDQPEYGSIIAVSATDAPMAPHQLKRMARRAAYGIARSGGVAANESGDLFMSFSTANRTAVEQHGGIVQVEQVGELGMTAFYEAVIEATDEAIMNSLFANQTMVGRDGRTVYGLPINKVRAILKRHGRLVEA
jgi:D-aminopeptidase